MRREEDAIQRAVFQHIKARGAPGVFAFHVPNGGYRRAREGAILKGLGVTPGVPDVMIVFKGRIYGLELKRPGGKPTEKQLLAMDAMDEAGAFVCMADGLDRALAVLEGWGILRGKTARSAA